MSDNRLDPDLDIPEGSHTYLSNVYKYVEEMGLMGHQIGRKIGDMLEVLSLGYIFRDGDLRDRVEIEEAMEGFTGAKHKVEFALYELVNGVKDKRKPLGFIECKKVGVEVTRHSATRRSPIRLRVGESYEHTINPRWLQERKTVVLNVDAIDAQESRITLTIRLQAALSGRFNDELGYVVEKTGGKPKVSQFDMGIGDKIQFPILENEEMEFIGPKESLRSIKGNIRVCHSFNLQKVSSDSAYLTIYTCLTGPQTIEKAKQAAFVALDLRRRIDGKWGKEEIESEKKFISVIIIGEASHWESKSRKVVRTAIDHALIVPDELIVALFQRFESEFGIAEFLQHITKDEFQRNASLREIVSDTIDRFEGRVFYNMDSKRFVDIKYQDGAIVTEEIETT